MDKSIFEVLERTKELTNKYNEKVNDNGEQFNLLIVSGVSRLEVNVCRILAELLKPDGLHNVGDLFLKSFIRNVLNVDVSDEEIKSAKVHTEYLINENTHTTKENSFTHLEAHTAYLEILFSKNSAVIEYS